MRALAVAIAVIVAVRAAADEPHILDIGKERAARVLVTVGDEAPAELDAGSPMLQRLTGGIIADLKGPELAKLRAAVPMNPLTGDPRGADRLCTLHLIGKTAARRLAVLRAADGSIVAQELEGESPRAVTLRLESMRALLLAWPQYRGGFAPVAGAGGAGGAADLEQPYTPSLYTMDKPTLGDRFLQRSTTNIDGVVRDLASEKLRARPARGYDPRTPAGLLVWINAGPEGGIPAVFVPALDELGIVCIAPANVGNERPAADRYQLALDAVATASRRFHIDPRRVYITGISGGGRISSALLGCFPEVFTGAAPIVGLYVYQRVPVGNGQYWPAGYVKPDARLFALLKTRRIGSITGSRDFNHDEIVNATDILARDGVDARVFDYEGMSHEMPTADRFLEVLTWVDGPARRAVAEEEAAAAKLVEAYAKAHGASPPADEKQRALLVRATGAGPWTASAWRACELLGAAPMRSEPSGEPSR